LKVAGNISLQCRFIPFGLVLLQADSLHICILQANQRVEEYKRQIKSLTVKLKEVSLTLPCE